MVWGQDATYRKPVASITRNSCHWNLRGKRNRESPRNNGGENEINKNSLDAHTPTLPLFKLGEWKRVAAAPPAGRTQLTYKSCAHDLEERACHKVAAYKDGTTLSHNHTTMLRWVGCPAGVVLVADMSCPIFGQLTIIGPHLALNSHLWLHLARSSTHIPINSLHIVEQTKWV